MCPHAERDDYTEGMIRGAASDSMKGPSRKTFSHPATSMCTVFLRSVRFALLLVTSFAVSAAAAEPVDFVHDVAPILKTRCLECHSGDKPKGKFSLETRAQLLAAEIATPGKADTSE